MVDPGSDEGDPRARRAWRIAGLGALLLGGGLAALAAIAGAGGRTGMRFFLLGAFLATGSATLYAIVTGAVDSYRERPVGRRRVVAAAVLGVLTIFVLPPMMIGLSA